jgi:RNA polymerase sigma factor (sigma-70 family)
MQREADRYCRTAKAKASGYETRDEYYYTSGIIEELIANLDEVLEPSHSPQSRVSGGGGDPAAGNNFLVSVIDVRAALEKLEPVDRLMLEMRFQESQTLEQIAGTLDLSSTTVHRRVKSALKRMIKDLGGDSPFTGVRRVVSNSQARSMLES